MIRGQRNFPVDVNPAKPYYESNAFVGVLLWALLELDDPDVPLRAAL